MFLNNKLGRRLTGRSGNDFPKPLSTISPGQMVEIVELDAGRELWTRMESMGIFPDSQAKVLTNYGFGPLLLALGDNRIILGRGIAEKVIVQPCQTSKEFL